jgi:hypothetical protein
VKRTAITTDLRSVEHVGPAPWANVLGQRSCKYACPALARSIALPWVGALIERMIGTLPDANLVDVRWWERLEPGDLPGIPNWHFDCFNRADSDRSEGEEHRLYFAGAGCRPMFRPDVRPEEGWIHAYGHGAEHRIMPATIAGPRLLVRVTRADLRPTNRVGRPPLIRG